MSLQFFSNKARSRHYNKPEEVLSDIYLTPLQKSMVLEALLSEVEEQDRHGIGRSRYVEKINQARERLKSQLF